MISLLSPILTGTASRTSGSQLFLRDCVQYVMQFTDTKTTLSMFRVCHSWYHAVDRFLLMGETFYYFPEMYRDVIIRHRTIPPCVSFSLETFQEDVRWGYVEVMVLKMQDTLQDIESFPPSLTSLCFRESNGIRDECVAQISKTTSLRLLDLSRCDRITDVGFAHLSVLTSLTSLNLWGCNRITDAGLAHVSRLISLTSLDLCFCDQIADAGLAHVSKLTSLTSLDLWGCNRITDAGLAHVSRLISLTSLDL
eukprot:PhF_6_TR7027/c2_g2_i1/m.10509/K10280/FBXL14; F-box and leucine-rich repeat protein 14